jgi:3-phenylpropionate/trans-cinnamate dioxygenase ferredoxin subunit
VTQQAPGVTRGRAEATRHAFPAAELPAGSRRVVTVDRREVCIFNVGGDLYAIRNVCPHQQAPLSFGTLTGATYATKVGEYLPRHEGKVLHCPWHKYAYSIEDGSCISQPDLYRVKTYRVVREEDEIALYV